MGLSKPNCNSMTATWTQEVEVKPINKPLTTTHIFKIKNKISRSQTLGQNVHKDFENL